jgi:rhodanese-related sulfurtransferase
MGLRAAEFDTMRTIMSRIVSPQAIYDRLGLADAPLVVDTRSTADLAALPRLIPGALHFDARSMRHWSQQLPTHRPIVLCGRTGEFDVALLNAVAAHNHDVSWLAGGVAGWIDQQRPTIAVRTDLGVPGRSQWITRERPKIDRLACPWLLRRFIDPAATFFYVPAQSVRAQATTLRAEPFDIPDVTFSHRGARCSFDAFLDEFDLQDPPLQKLAHIVRAADTGELAASVEAPGLLAISLGLAATIRDDHLLLEQAMLVYDALYVWCKTSPHESHFWPTTVTEIADA